MKVKYTIITICKNAENSIRQTVDSVLMQDFSEYEYIIIDGASTDGTLNILNSYKRKEMKIYSEPDRGISDAFNKGVKKAAGEFLFFLNSGDYLLSKDVLKLVESDTLTHAADIYTYAILTSTNDYWPRDEKHGLRLWEESLIPHQATFIHRNVFKKVGLFNEFFKVRMDYDFFFRCRRAELTCFCHPTIITYYDMNGISANNPYLYNKEGLSVQLLYQDNIGDIEKREMEFLLGESILMKGNPYYNELFKLRASSSKNGKIIQAMSRWLEMQQNGKNIAQYFQEHSMKKIAIYGAGYLGKRLKTELDQNGIEVAYFIDQSKKEDGICSWEDDWEEVDCVVVTTFYIYKEICEKICKKGSYKVISFEQLLI